MAVFDGVNEKGGQEHGDDLHDDKSDAKNQGVFAVDVKAGH